MADVFLSDVEGGVGVIDKQSGPLCHLPQMAACIIKVFDCCDLCVWRQFEGQLRAWLVSKNAWGDCNVVGFIENVTQVSIVCAAIPGSHVTEELPRVSIPELFSDAAGRVAMGRHDQRCNPREAFGDIFDAHGPDSDMSTDLANAC